MVQTKKFILKQHFCGHPSEDNFKLVEEELQEICDGEVLCKAEYWSVDPYMRARGNLIPEGSTMIGYQVAIVIESKNEKYPVGSHIVGNFGWRDYTIYNPATFPAETSPYPTVYPMPELGDDISRSYFLGVLGRPGNSAYFGFLELCLPQPGNVVVVSGAAGAVGHLVGQIARIRGCKVIGYAGSDEKVLWLKNELGFDHAYNYKKVDLDESLNEAAPEGVDCYFDNVGGTFSHVVLNHMNNFGRISVCGSISSYNAQPGEQVVGPVVQQVIVQRQLRMEGFIVSRFGDRRLEGNKQLVQWIREGKLKFRETVTPGFENIPSAFIEMLKGVNIGKAIVKAA